MPNPIPGPTGGRRVVQVLEDRGVTYEQRHNTCGKSDCKRCNGVATEAVGHGPYWYFCVTVKGKWVRIYLGKFLDTARFRTPDGSIDWGAVMAKRSRARAHPAVTNDKAPALTEPAAAACSDASPPPTAAPQPTCYVCGRDMREDEADRNDPPAYNLCTKCHVLGFRLDDAPPTVAPTAQPGQRPVGQRP